VNAGCRALDVTDAVQGAKVPVHAHLAMNAPIDGAPLPLVVLSHGGSTPWVFRDLASHLAMVVSAASR
jgi:predicted dienelactone hydrolase